MQRQREWRVFGLWTLVGLGSMWSLWTLLSWGWVIGLITAAFAFRIATREEPGRSAWGYVVGIGLAPLWVVWGNRAEPGPIDSWLLWGGLATAALGMVAFVASRKRPGSS